MTTVLLIFKATLLISFQFISTPQLTRPAWAKTGPMPTEDKSQTWRSIKPVSSENNLQNEV